MKIQVPKQTHEVIEVSLPCYRKDTHTVIRIEAPATVTSIFVLGECFSHTRFRDANLPQYFLNNWQDASEDDFNAMLSSAAALMSDRKEQAA